MARVKKVLNNLIEGVSQQPATIRYPTQCEEQINAYANVVEGLRKRPPTEHLARLSDTPPSEVFLHTINRDIDNRFVAVFAEDDLKVYDFEGDERTVNFPNGKEYLASLTPSSSFACTTVADYTFVVNRDMKVRVQNPFDGINLNPITEDRWVISFRRVPGNSVSYDFSKSSQYRCTVNGRLVEEFPETERVNWGGHGSADINKSFYAEPSLQQYLIKVRQALSDAYGITGEVIGQEIHMKTDTIRNIVDESRRCTVTKQPHKSHWHVGQTISAYNTITSSVVKQVLVGYESDKGDIIPPRAIIKNEGLFFIQSPDFSTTYTAQVDNEIFQYITDDTDRATVNTEFIASQLKTSMDANAYMTTNFDLTLDGSRIRVRAKADNFDFSMESRDSKGDSAMFAIKDKTQDISDLPANCFEGFTCAIIGTGTIDERYYVTYDEGETGDETGAWIETSAPGLNNELVAKTMPHQLISNADGTFTFKVAEWEKRKAGDEDTNPEPSFVNRTINDVFFYRNRLGLLSDENMLFSEDGEYYNFYPLTVRTTLDSSPIDVGSTSDRVSILKHAVTFNERLLVFADTVQFAPNIGDSGILSAATISMDVSTRFEAQLKAKPVGAGQNVFFVVDQGNYSGVREYFVAPGSQINDAANITSHVPTYIPGQVIQMTASSSQDIVACLTDDNSQTLYIYTYFWAGNEKQQSAWSKWSFDGEVKSITFIESRLFIVISRPEGMMLESVDLSKFIEPVSEGWPTDILLDRRKLIRSGEPRGTLYADSETRAVLKTGQVYEGDRVDTLYPNDVASQDHYLGVNYLMEYTFSEQVINEGEQGKPNLIDRVQLQRMHLNYADSGYFDVFVSTPTTRGRLYKFTGKVLGSITNILGKPNLASGAFRFPILANSRVANIIIQSNEHLPCSFQTAEWEALTNPRAQVRN